MIKLYDEDSYIKKFLAKVEECEKTDAGYKILLDRTAFFPTAGGQMCDTGKINGYEVSDVIEENGRIYHIVCKEIPNGSEIFGEIDWQVRFRKMQHHTAEHIVSGIVHSMFGYENTGFHLSEREVTMDFGGILSEDELLEVERKANAAIWDNRTVSAYYPGDEELAATEYRSKLELSENVRLVKIDGIDVCACCAPHVKKTGEIGVIKLTGLMRHRGGVRLNLICGPDALADYEEKAESAYNISKLLSAKQCEIFEAVKRVCGELAEEKQKIAAYERKLAEMRAERFLKTDENICAFEKELESEAMRLFANEGKKRCKIFAVFSGNDQTGYSFCATSEKVKLREYAVRISAELSGKCGGTNDMLRGFLKAEKTRIEKFFREI